MRLISTLAAAVLVAGCSRGTEKQAAPAPAAPPAPVDISVWLAQPMPQGSAVQQRVEAARLACLATRDDGCAILGLAYEEGAAVATDLVRARAAYERGCDLGQGLGCDRLGALYRDGRGVAKDPARAVTLFQRGCDQRSLDACTDLGFTYLLADDPEKARPLFQKACDGGVAKACTGLGATIRQTTQNLMGLVVNDPKARAAWRDGLARAEAPLRKACDGADAVGCFELGEIFRVRANRSDRDLETVSLRARASEAYGKSCVLGYARACAAQGNEEDMLGHVQLAVELYRKACDGGYGPGCSSVAGVLEERREPGDLKAAVGWLEKGCGAGDASACQQLGRMYYKGTEDVPKDLALAKARYLRECELDPKACFRAAEPYCNGAAGVVDERLAVALFERACARMEHPAPDETVDKAEMFFACKAAKSPECKMDDAYVPIRVERAAGPDGRTMAEIFANKAALKNKAVSVRAKVRRFTADIAGSNWAHLDDGTGKEGERDLPVRTSEVVQRGEVVVFTGVLKLDLDLGFGKYPVLLDRAKLTR
jgi:TPR repeat protein